MTAEQAPTTHRFEAEVHRVLGLVINSLYSNKEIFLRELISNASDALDRLRFEGIANPALLPAGHDPVIRLIPDTEAKTLTLWDNGIGMTEEQLVKDLGTVARSGTREFLDKLEASKQQLDSKLIGQFGVGFYSGYLVADRIEVVTRAAGSEQAHRWTSDGQETFSVEPAERDSIGSSIVLHLKEEHHELLEEWRLRDLVRRYSDFIPHRIELQVTREKPKPAKEGDEANADEAEGGAETETRFERINEASALWTRPEKDITDEQYDEFYKHLTHDWQPPLTRSHFHVEGTQLFSGLLYVPRQPPMDLLSPEGKHGVRLYVRRVFIMDDCDALLPRWLRFVRGVVDSDDLPLNVSRELLQDSHLVNTIRKQVVKRVLDALLEVADERPDDYADFWGKFGAVLKEGLHFEPSHKDKLGKLTRYASSTQEGLVSLDSYIERMPEGQEGIYYAIGPTAEMLRSGPQLEGLRARGIEVLLMTDGVDQWAVEGLSEYGGKPLVNALEAELDLTKLPDEKKNDDAEANAEPDAEAFKPLIERCAAVLDAHVGEVRLSQRLTDSPVCLVLPKGGMPAHLERLIRQYQQDLPTQKRVLEINPKHPLVERLRGWHAEDDKSERVTEWIEMLYDQALLAEGSPLPDPARFATRIATLMQQSA
jgi:molecular chaperone HtpG